MASLVNSVVMATGTALFRHCWAVFSLALTMLATVVLLIHMRG